LSLAVIAVVLLLLLGFGGYRLTTIFMHPDNPQPQPNPPQRKELGKPIHVPVDLAYDTPDNPE
jgi:hypothetical protein